MKLAKLIGALMLTALAVIAAQVSISMITELGDSPDQDSAYLFGRFMGALVMPIFFGVSAFMLFRSATRSTPSYSNASDAAIETQPNQCNDPNGSRLRPLVSMSALVVMILCLEFVTSQAQLIACILVMTLIGLAHVGFGPRYSKVQRANRRESVLKALKGSRALRVWLVSYSVLGALPLVYLDINGYFLSTRFVGTRVLLLLLPILVPIAVIGSRRRPYENEGEINRVDT